MIVKTAEQAFREHAQSVAIEAYEDQRCALTIRTRIADLAKGTYPEVEKKTVDLVADHLAEVWG